MGADGEWIAEDLMEGVYEVIVDLPAGYVHVDSEGRTTGEQDFNTGDDNEGTYFSRQVAMLSGGRADAGTATFHIKDRNGGGDAEITSVTVDGVACTLSAAGSMVSAPRGGQTPGPPPEFSDRQDVARLRRAGPGVASRQSPGQIMPPSRLSAILGPKWRMWTPPDGQARIRNRVGGSLVRYCRMSGLLMQPLLAAGPYGVRKIGSKSDKRAPRPSATYWFFRSRLVDRLPLPRFLRPAAHISPTASLPFASLLSPPGQAAARTR